MKNLSILLLFFTSIFLAAYLISDTLKDIYDCEKNKGVLVKKIYGGYICIPVDNQK